MWLHFKLSLFYLYIIVLMDISQTKPQKGKLPFPDLTDFNASDIGKPLHIFEGVDYDQLPKKLKEKHTDCYGDQKQCIRHRNHFNPVCGYDPMYRSYAAFHNICELDLQNCLRMIRGGLGKYGKNLWDRYIYFLGEGPNCEYYVRQ